MLSGFLELMNKFGDKVISVLPTSPFAKYISMFENLPYLGILNWFIPVGTIVKVKDYDFDEEVEYSIVGSAEADPMNFKISNESPVGSALVGKKVGDIVEVAVPDGVNKFEVLGIRRD